MYLKIEGIFRRIENPSTEDIELAFSKLGQSNCSYIMLEVKDGEYFRLNIDDDKKYIIEYRKSFTRSIYTIDQKFSFNEARELFLKFKSDSSIDNFVVNWVEYEKLLRPNIISSLLILWLILFATGIDIYFNFHSNTILPEIFLAMIWIIYIKKYFKSIWFTLGKLWFISLLGKFILFSSMCVLFSWFILFIKIYMAILSSL